MFTISIKSHNVCNVLYHTFVQRSRGNCYNSTCHNRILVPIIESSDFFSKDDAFEFLIWMSPLVV